MRTAAYNLQKLIKDRRAEGLEGRNDTLSEMIRGTSGGEHMTDEEIQDQVRTSFSTKVTVDSETV
jgi:cytochrome P450